ncbi:unnamed protein product [Musa acuminata subsp. malaccensis]|uniref:(wild Malaysian banana) hypothetical protein n=1 Tax=Musa acuminata subsp. malaccensis TaxID=214687 RepID=A0A804IGZ5_MUSAM|nr:unnamed protein product [Musa acuminata subsp. malaccensis]
MVLRMLSVSVLFCNYICLLQLLWDESAMCNFTQLFTSSFWSFFWG